MIFVKIVIKKLLFVSCCEANLYSSVLELRTYAHAVLKSCLRGQTADVLYKLAPTTDTCICSSRMTVLTPYSEGRWRVWYWVGLLYVGMEHCLAYFILGIVPFLHLHLIFIMLMSRMNVQNHAVLEITYCIICFSSSVKYLKLCNI